jgi:hypothetical protein
MRYAYLLIREVHVDGRRHLVRACFCPVAAPELECRIADVNPVEHPVHDGVILRISALWNGNFADHHCAGRSAIAAPELSRARKHEQELPRHAPHQWRRVIECFEMPYLDGGAIGLVSAP